MAEMKKWKSCSSCKEDIALGAAYWTCNVSTCNRKRTALMFCSVSCWDAHLPVARHRDAWAEEQRAPRRASPEDNTPTKSASVRPPRSAQPAAHRARHIVQLESAQRPSHEPPREILVIASRLKDYVRARSGFNTSERALGPLSEILRMACDEAIRTARLEGRMTVLDRDIPHR